MRATEAIFIDFLSKINCLTQDLDDDYPLVGLSASELDNRQGDLASTTGQDVSFSGLRNNYCVSYVDLVGSTKIASQLPEDRISAYYGIFLNSVAKIAKNFAAKIIKNAGDCLIYYFPETSTSINSSAFKQVIECGLTLLDAREIINRRLYDESLPPMSYRISADYGKLEIVKTSSSRSKDLFGSTMNLCAKMNANAKPNNMVIGANLYKLVDSLKEYHFKVVGSYQLSPDSNYTIYSVRGERKQLTSKLRDILQARRALNIFSE